MRNRGRGFRTGRGGPLPPIGRGDLVPHETRAEKDPAAIWRERLDREAGKLGRAIVDAASDDGGVNAVLDTEANTITVAADNPRTPAPLSALPKTRPARKLTDLGWWLDSGDLTS
jgi:hypothetical protein